MVKVNRITNLSIQSLGTEWRLLVEIAIAGEPDQNRLAIEQITETVESFHLSARSTEQLKMATSRAVLNEIEHTNHADPHQPVLIRVLASPETVDARANPNKGLVAGASF